jgi:predicted MFS family arabinose efflux permease
MQAVIPSLVEPPQLLNAISLNSVQFNLARTLGPALGGLACGTIGPQGCFALNAAGFLVLTLMLARVRIPASATVAVLPMGRALVEGLRYARTHSVIRPALLLATVMSIFGFPYIILLPALAHDTLGPDPSAVGYLMAAVGGGAVVGGLVLSAVGQPARKELLALGSAIAFGLTLTAFALVPGPRGTALILFVLGALQTACIASLNTTIQMAVHDGMRGRVMSMMTVILFGFATSGALLIGYLGDRIGVPSALAGGGVVIALAATVAAFRPPLPLVATAADSRTAA